MTFAKKTERDIIDEAAEHFFMKWSFSEHQLFDAYLEAGSYVDAALMFVSENYAIERISKWPDSEATCHLYGTHEHNGGRWHQAKDGRWEGKGETIALAITNACLLAIGAITE